MDAKVVVDGTKGEQPLPQFSVMLPKDGPITSWSPASVAVFSVGLYPEAWAKLERTGNLGALSAALHQILCDTPPNAKVDQKWSEFCTTITPVWQNARASGGGDWSCSTRLSDWSRSILARVAMAGPGRSIRAFERRLKRWSTQSRQSLKSYSDMENLHRLSALNAGVDAAALVNDAGYSDQSHMVRAVRRATGFSPVQLNRHIEMEEAFWCYRLLGERF